MPNGLRSALVLLVVAGGCAKPAELAAPRGQGYGYENVDDPGAEAESAAARLPTTCASARCTSPRVCRLLSTSNPGGIAHAYCLGPDDELCKMDPKICQDGICRTQPGLCD